MPSRGSAEGDRLHGKGAASLAHLDERLPSNGRLLQAVAIGHGGIGALLFHSELRRIKRDGVLAAVPYKGPKATAFWFMVPVPLIWISGDLMNSAEEAGDASALRRASAVGLAASLTSAACTPVSGFWAWSAISLRGLRDAWRLS